MIICTKNTKNVVLAALKRKQSQLSSVQEKIFAINSQGGVAISGLSTDGARLVKLLRDESVREEFVYDRVTTPSRLAVAVSDASQVYEFISNTGEKIYTRHYSSQRKGHPADLLASD